MKTKEANGVVVGLNCAYVSFDVDKSMKGLTNLVITVGNSSDVAMENKITIYGVTNADLMRLVVTLSSLSNKFK